MATPARLAGVGVFVISGLLLFAVGLFMIGDRQMAFSRKFTVYTQFARIPGLAPGAVVRVSGAKAGSVKEVLPPNRPSDRFRVKLEITEDLHPLVRTDSVASIEIEGLVGGTFLSVGTGTDGAPKAPENSTIPSREPFQIADLLQQMSDTVKKVGSTIDELKDDAQRAASSIADTAENANAMIDDVQDDVKTVASAAARITGDVAEISDNIRNGKGTIGKLVNDDELYRRATGIAKQTEEITTNMRQVVEQARNALASLQSKDGPVQGLTSNVKQTMDEARAAAAALAENMEALKHNFLFRGFFNRRGYFDLANISPVEYRRGALTQGGNRGVVRVWLGARVLFEPPPDDVGSEQLADGAKARLDSAIASYLDRLTDAVLMVEGYAQQGTEDEQYVRSRARAAMVREYLIGKFHLDPQAIGLMPLEAKRIDTGHPWDGIALAVFMAKDSRAKGN